MEQLYIATITFPEKPFVLFETSVFRKGPKDCQGRPESPWRKTKFKKCLYRDYVFGCCRLLCSFVGLLLPQQWGYALRGPEGPRGISISP